MACAVEETITLWRDDEACSQGLTRGSSSVS